MICIGLIILFIGPKLLEYNVWFRDPKVQTLLPILDDKFNFAEIMLAYTERTLYQVHMSFVSRYVTFVIIASKSYLHFY